MSLTQSCTIDIFSTSEMQLLLLLLYQIYPVTKCCTGLCLQPGSSLCFIQSFIQSLFYTGCFFLYRVLIAVQSFWSRTAFVALNRLEHETLVELFTLYFFCIFFFASKCHWLFSLCCVTCYDICLVSVAICFLSKVTMIEYVCVCVFISNSWVICI